MLCSCALHSEPPSPKTAALGIRRGNFGLRFTELVVSGLVSGLCGGSRLNLLLVVSRVHCLSRSSQNEVDIIVRSVKQSNLLSNIRGDSNNGLLPSSQHWHDGIPQRVGSRHMDAEQ
jgi:hypothetical protein